MSWFSEILSGGGGAKEAALSQLANRTRRDFRQMSSQYMESFTPIMQQYSRERAANIDLYRADMERARADFARYFDQARVEFGTGMDRAISELRTGRESTIEVMRQQTERERQRAISSGAFTGLGQTSFGSAQVASISRQGALQEGVIREQYAAQLSAAEAQRASGMSALSTQMGQGLSAIAQQQGAGVSSLYQQYSAGIASAQQAALNNQYAMMQHGYNLAANFRGQATQYVGGAWQAGGQVVGAVAGGVAGGFGSALGSLFGR